MPETTPLIKAALNLRVGAGFDVYNCYRSLFSYKHEKAHGLQFISMRLFTIILILNCFPIILNA
jgi:hypothetical protein